MFRGNIWARWMKWGRVECLYGDSMVCWGLAAQIVRVQGRIGIGGVGGSLELWLRGSKSRSFSMEGV